MPPSPSVANSAACARSRLLAAAAEILCLIEGEPPESIVIDLLGMLRQRLTKLRLETSPGEPASILGWGARLDEDEIGILKALSEADEPLPAKNIARKLEIDPDNSTLRARLGPRAKLRAEGFMSHAPEEGYGLTEKGRNALESYGQV